MLTCKQTSQLLSEQQDRPLTRRERWGMKLHLFICISCRRFNRQLGLLRRALHQLAKGEISEELGPELPPEAQQRIRHNLSEQKGNPS